MEGCNSLLIKFDVANFGNIGNKIPLQFNGIAMEYNGF